MLGAFSIGNELRHQQLDADVPGMRKYWLTAGDGRVRPDHVAAGARYAPGGSVGPIPMADDYLIGVEHAAYPHDPRLSASQRIACRCISVAWNPDWFGATTAEPAVPVNEASGFVENVTRRIVAALTRHRA